MVEPVGATLRTLLAWQPDGMTGQRLGVVEFADVAIDLGLKLRKRLKSARVEGEDELTGICNPVRLGVEIDAVPAKQCTIKRPGEKTKRKRKPGSLVARHRQQQRLNALVRINNGRAGLRVDHPVVAQRLILQTMILDRAVRDDRCRNVENDRGLLTRRNSDR